MTHLIDRSSPGWMRLKRHMLDRIESLRDQLETASDPARVSALQGRVSELRMVLEAVEPPETEQPNSEPVQSLY